MNQDSASVVLAAELTDLVRNLPTDTALPSYRELQKRYRLGPQTVQQAVALLVSRGLVVTHPGRGSFTAGRRPGNQQVDGDHGWQTLTLGTSRQFSQELPRLIQPSPVGMLPLANSFLDESLQPIGLIGAAAGRAARRPLTWSRLPVEGMPELRTFFAAELGGGARAGQVIVTGGGQGALTAAFRYLAEPGAPVVFESPTYGGAMAGARAAGLRVVPVPSDEQGVLPDALDYAVTNSGARLIYLQTRHANPTGATLPLDRRQEVLEIAARARAFIIEDDWVRDFDLDQAAPAPLATQDADGHVIYIRSLTKPMAAGVRVAALIARGAAFERLRLGRASDELFVAPILQQTALDVLTSPGWQRHLGVVRRRLIERRDALLGALAQQAPLLQPARTPGGGLLLWVRLPAGRPALPFVAYCRANGLAVEPGDWYFPRESTGSYLRLSYAAAESSVMAAAGAILGDACQLAPEELIKRFG